MQSDRYRVGGISFQNQSSDGVAPRKLERHWSILVFAASAVAYLLMNARMLWLRPMHDDWIWIDTAVQAFQGETVLGGLWRILTTKTDTFWRPLCALPLAFGGPHLFYSQIAKLAGVIILSLLMVPVAKRLGLGRHSAWLSAAVLLLHQNMVLGGEPDWWGDLICSLCVLSLFWVGLLPRWAPTKGIVLSLAAAGLTAVALLAKEAGTVTPVVVLGAGLIATGFHPQRRNFRSYIVAVSAIVVILIIYVIARQHVGLGIQALKEHARYSLHVGWNLAFSPAIAWLALLSPVNTIKVALGGLFWKLLAALWMLGLTLVAGFGLWKLRSHQAWKIPVVLLILFFAVQGPSLLLEHTTEWNMSRSLPFGILFMAVVLRALWISGPARARIIMMSVGLVWLVWSVVATQGKLSALVREHNESWEFFANVRREMPVPPPRPVLFVVEQAPRPTYSVYEHPLWSALQCDVPIGLRYYYSPVPYEGRYVMVSSFKSVPDSLLTADFFVTADGSLLRQLPGVPPSGPHG